MKQYIYDLLECTFKVIAYGMLVGLLAVAIDQEKQIYQLRYRIDNIENYDKVEVDTTQKILVKKCLN